MASVEPAGMIPNLNHSFGTGNSGALSSEPSKATKKKHKIVIIIFYILLFILILYSMK